MYNISWIIKNRGDKMYIIYFSLAIFSFLMFFFGILFDFILKKSNYDGDNLDSKDIFSEIEILSDDIK